MTKPSNQDIEKYYFEMFRKDYSLPSGMITYSDAPDVVLEGTKKVGIEITNLYLEEGALPESEQAQSKLREKVITTAQKTYQSKNGKYFEISFGFNKANPIIDQKTLINNIVRLAESIKNNGSGRVFAKDFEMIPELSFVYLNSNEYPDAKWRIVQVYDVQIISRDRLLDIIRNKEQRAKKYKSCDEYWLLVVVDPVNPAQEQEIRAENFEKFQTDVF